MNSLLKNPDLTIIVPCLNEEKNILNTLNSLSLALIKFNISGEIIVIDDGSTDNTYQVLENNKYKFENIRIIKNNINKGIGKSFSSSVKISNGNYIVMIPGDNENNPFEVFRYFELRNHVDIIIPFIVNRNSRSLNRRLISSIFRFINNLFFGLTLNYMNGTVIYNAEMIKSVEISSSGFFYQTEILIKLIRQGYLYAEIPQIIEKRNHGSSKALTIKSLISVLISFIILLYNIHILRSCGMATAYFSKKTASANRLNL